MSQDKQVGIIERTEQVAKAALEIASPETRDLSKEGAFQVGHNFWQGDLGFERIASVPEKAVLVQNPASQLVEGTTRGARHCVKQEDMRVVKMYRIPGADALTGMVLETSAPCEIVHPEHGNVVLPKGTFQTRFQRQFSPLGELKRQRD